MKKKHMSRRNKIDANKLATVFLVTIVALAGAGIAYSMWTQDLTITGIIETGEVKIGLYDLRTLDPGPSFVEGGELYPNSIDQMIYDPEIHGTADLNEPPGYNPEEKNIASHKSLNDGTDVTFTKTVDGVVCDFTDHITERVDYVYPWYKSGTEIYVSNGGTIPVKITDVVYIYVSGNESLLDFLVIEGWTVREYSDAAGWSSVGSGVSLDDLVNTLICFQLDPCHTLSIEIYFHFKEELDDGSVLPEEESLTFDIKISAAQWNEVPCDVPPPPFCEPDLTLEKTVYYVEGQPYLGSYIEYTITVTNNGDCDAENVEVNDLLPDGLTYDSHSESHGTYYPGSGLWDIGTLPDGETATLIILAQITDTGTSATAPTQLALVIDGSDSINTTEWSLCVNGVANAIEDPAFPHDGSIELTVVQFGGSSARVEIDPIVISDSTVQSSVATRIRAILKNLGSDTPLGEGLTLTADTLIASANYTDYPRTVVNIVTDGQPTYPYGGGTPFNAAEQAAIDARNYLLSLLGMNDEADGEIDAEAIGDNTDIPWLQANIVWPGSYLWTPPTPPTGPGWVRYVEDYAGFEEAIREKFETILTGIENCAELTADNFTPVEECITINPVPAQVD